MNDTQYTKRELDMQFTELKAMLTEQNTDLREIKTQTKATNGNVAKAFLQIADTKADIASNWRAIVVGTTILTIIVIPLCGIIYYNLQGTIKTIQYQLNKSK